MPALKTSDYRVPFHLGAIFKQIGTLNVETYKFSLVARKYKRILSAGCKFQFGKIYKLFKIK